jgi:hypothetical protein
MGMVTPAMSTSWKESFPSMGSVTLAVIATMGMESM